MQGPVDPCESFGCYSVREEPLEGSSQEWHALIYIYQDAKDGHLPGCLDRMLRTDRSGTIRETP